MQTYKIQEIHRKQNLAIILVSRINIDVCSLPTNCVHAYLARIEPAWLVIREAPNNLALNIQAEPVDIDELCEFIPELRDFISVV